MYACVQLQYIYVSIYVSTTIQNYDHVYLYENIALSLYYNPNNKGPC